MCCVAHPLLNKMKTCTVWKFRLLFLSFNWLKRGDILYFLPCGIKASSKLSSFHLESSEASYGALLGKPLMNHDHSRCRENANQELLLSGETRRLRASGLSASVHLNRTLNVVWRFLFAVWTKTKTAEETRGLWGDGARGEPLNKNPLPVRRRNHAASGGREAEAAPCVGTDVRSRWSHNPASDLDEPGLPSEREAPAVRLRTWAQGELRPGWRRSRGQDQPHRQLHHQRIPDRICSDSVRQLHR